MRITNGGARKKEWEYIIKNKKPMYVNTKKNLEHPIFLNKNGRPSYRNIHGVMMWAKDYPKKYVPLLKKETLKISEGDKKSIKKTKKKLILKKKTAAPRPKTPTKETRVDSKIPPSFFGSPPNQKTKKKTPTPKIPTPKTPTPKTPTPKTPTPKTPTPKTPSRDWSTPSRDWSTITKTPTPKPKTPTPKPKTPTPKPKTPTPKPKTPTPKPKTPTPKQKCGSPGLPRCKKGTICNKRIGQCVPSGKQLKTTRKTTTKKSDTDSLQIMKYQEEDLKELGLNKNDFYEDVCLVLKNIRKKLHVSNDPNQEQQWNSKKLVKMHNLVPHTRDKNGKMIKGTNIERDQYLGGKSINILRLLGKGGYGKVWGGTYGGRPCAIKESHEPMDTKEDIEDYYGEIIKQNELFCQAHRAKLSEPKYARIPKPLFMAIMDKTPILGMEPLDDSLYKFIKKSKRQGDIFEYKINMTKVITDMFECLCNTLIYLQDKYDFYHRDMHCGNIMYRKTGKSYQWYLIDFGFSTFRLHNYRFSENGAGPYGRYKEEKAQQGKAHKGRVGHDLRLTLLYMFELIEDKLEDMILPEAFTILKDIYLQIRYDIITKSIGSSPNFWHRGYEDAFNKLVTTQTEPKNFLKDTIPRLRVVISTMHKVIFNTKTKSPSKPTKEYIYVQRNKSWKRLTPGGSPPIKTQMLNIVNGYITLINTTASIPQQPTKSVRKLLLENSFEKIKALEGDHFIPTISITDPFVGNQTVNQPQNILVNVDTLFFIFPLNLLQHDDTLEIPESQNVLIKLTKLRNDIDAGDINIEGFNNSLRHALTRNGHPYLGTSIFNQAVDVRHKKWAGEFIFKIISDIGATPASK